MMDIKFDLSIVIYIVTILIDLYGIGLFGWWWIKRRSATLMFKCVTILFIGDAIERAFNIYGRWMILYCPGQYETFARSWWYGSRILMASVTTLVVVVYMSIRVIKRMTIVESHPQRRITDK